MSEFILMTDPFYALKEGDVICRPKADPVLIEAAALYCRYDPAGDGPLCGFIVDDMAGIRINVARRYCHLFTDRKIIKVWKKKVKIPMNKNYSQPLPLP